MPQWIPVAGGHLALDHRPKVKTLRDLGATHILTLLSEREGARALGREVEKAGLGWLWLPLENGDPPPEERSLAVRETFARVAPLLAAGGRVLVHCSAGIHRTGMVGHALLRSLGLSAADARATLARLRTETASGVGEHRLAWGERFAPARGE